MSHSCHRDHRRASVWDEILLRFLPFPSRLHELTFAFLHINGSICTFFLYENKRWDEQKHQKIKLLYIKNFKSTTFAVKLWAPVVLLGVEPVSCVNLHLFLILPILYAWNTQELSSNKNLTTSLKGIKRGKQPLIDFALVPGPHLKWTIIVLFIHSLNHYIWSNLI